MNISIETIEKYVGKDKLNRALEVLNMFGMKIPEVFDVYDKEYYRGLGHKVTNSDLGGYRDNYAIVLVDKEDGQNFESISEEELCKIGYFEFNGFRLKIAFIKDGFFYEWEKSGDRLEHLYISEGKKNNYENDMTVVFRRENDGLKSSVMWIKGKYDSPPIFSYIDKVEGIDNCIEFKEEAPIEEYYDFFNGLLFNKHFNFVIPDVLKNEHILNKVSQVFKSPIEDLVNALQNDDQNWRFKKEKEKINDDCKREKDKALTDYRETVEKAKKLYVYLVQTAEDKKTRRLEELAKQSQEYNETLESSTGLKKH